MDGAVSDFNIIRKVFGSLTATEFDGLISLASMLSGCESVVVTLFGEPRLWRRTPVGISVEDYDGHTTLRDPAMSFYLDFPLKGAHGFIYGHLHFMNTCGHWVTSEIRLGLEAIVRLTVDRIEMRVDEARRELQVQLQNEKQNDFLNAVLENLSDGVVACNERGELTVFNRATRELHGLDSRSDIPPEQWASYYRLFYEDGKTPLNPSDIPLRRAFVEGSVKDMYLVIESVAGEKRTVNCGGRAIYDRDGQKAGAVVTMKDMTEIHKARAESESSLKMLQALIDTCPVGIAMYDLDARVRMWNPWKEKTFGWSKEEVLGGPLPHRDPRQREEVLWFIAKVLQTKSKVVGQGKRTTRDGKVIDVNLSMLPLFDDRNEICGFMDVVIDITDQKEREAKLLEANRALKAASVAKSEFLANMSHEIRTPLNGVIGMTEMVLASELTEEQRDQLQISHASANSLLAIISDILDFSKIEAGKLEIEKTDFDLPRMITEVKEGLALSAKHKNLKLISHFKGAPISEVMGDPVRIRQVLINLMSNAIKFSDNAEIEINVTVGEEHSGMSLVRFEVRDYGVGIPTDVLPRLFQAFSQADSSTTRRFGGTGLGLSICKRLVDLMKGQIGVESQVGSGSTFWFEIQLEHDKRKIKRVDHAACEPREARKNLRILLAEDNSVNQKVALSMLARLGYTADVVSNGSAAVEAVKRGEYDLILMDCQMPEMDGFEATRMIRSLAGPSQKTKVIALTANAMKGDRERCLEAGMDDYVAKPLALGSLQDVIRRQAS